MKKIHVVPDKVIPADIDETPREGLKEGKREAIESLLKQGLLTKEQAKKALKELEI